MMKSKIIRIILIVNLLSCSHKVTHKDDTVPVKNVVFIIGDGMGPQQLELLQLYAKYAKNSIYKDKGTHFEKMARSGEIGMVEVNPNKFLVTDSSCSATQYATGEYSLPETVGINDSGLAVKTIIDVAKRLGKSTGIVTDTRITHATPASFIAHIGSRKHENEIAEQFIDSNVDVLLGGGLRHFLPKNTKKNKFSLSVLPSHINNKSKRFDNRNLLEEANKKGYDLLFSKDALLNSKSDKILGLFKSSGLPDGIEYRDNLYPKIPSLKDMASVALKSLSKNKKGFFLMIEAGQIDWAGHQNDTGLMLAEMQKMDEMLGSVLKWASGRDDTIVVLTADHETGSFGFSYNALVKNEQYPVSKTVIKSGLYKPKFNYGNFNVLDKIQNQKLSFANTFNQYYSLDINEQTAQSLQKIVNDNNDFKIDIEAAKRIIKTKKNPYYDKDHSVFYKKHLPAIIDFAPFYPITRNSFASLIGREMSAKQNTVWGSGSHTSTAIILVAHGPKTVTKKFDGLHHSTEIGKILQEVLKEEK